VLGLDHEHQRSRPYFDDKGNPIDNTGNEVKTNDPDKARLYYLGLDFNGKPDPALKKAQISRWNSLYIPAGPYDLQSLMHYPEAINWRWSYEPYRKLATAIAALNYPSTAQVIAGAWAPSDDDIDTLQDLYS
jgi:hypothetical protein